MSDENASESTKFQGIQFDSSALSQLPVPAQPITTIPINALPVTVPDSWTPLGGNDSAVAGVNEGASQPPQGANVHLVPYLQFVGRLTGAAGTINDSFAVGQHLLTGRVENALIEVGGVVGQTAGATIGYAGGSLIVAGASSTPPGWLVVGSGMVLSGFGAFGGSTTGKDLTAQALNELNRTADLAAGQTVQQVATVDGVRYGLGLTVDGKYDWYRIDTYGGDTRTTFAASSGAVASRNSADRNALTDQFAQASMSTADYATYQRMVNEIQTLGDTSENIQSRIEPTGSVAVWGDDYRPEGANHPAPFVAVGANGMAAPAPAPVAAPTAPYDPGVSPADGDPLALSGQSTYTGDPLFNVARGLTPSGYTVGAMVYEINGQAHTVGVGSRSETVVPVAMVSSYRDESTNAIIEVRVQGELVNGQFQATGGSYAQGMTPDGKVVIPGVIDDPNASAILQTQQLQDTFIRGEAAYANGLGPDGKPWNTATTVAPNATQAWGQTGSSSFVTRITEVTNPNGVVTRISETVDRSTGQVVTTHVYEDGNLVATSEGGNRWALNRDTGQMEHVAGPTAAGADGAATAIEPPRASSSSFVNSTGEYTVTLNPRGTLSDIVLLQNRAGNPITSNDLLAANPQYTDVTKIPPGVTLNVPVRSGDILTIYRSSGAVETINSSTAEIISTTRDIQGNTHVVISRPDGESGRIYVERTLHAGTGEEISSSAVRVDTITGEVTAVDPVTLVPLSTDADMEEGTASDGFTTLTPEQIEALGTPPAPGDPIAVIADAGEGTMTDGGPQNGLGLGSQNTDPPSPVVHTDETTGWSWFEDEKGNTTYLSPSGQAVSEAEYNGAVFTDAASALNLFTGVVNGVENWVNLNDGERLAALATLYNQIDHLGAAMNGLDLGGAVAANGNLPGNLGTASSVIGLINALNNGNEQAIVTGGLQLGSVALNAYSDFLIEEAFAAIADSTLTDAAASAAFESAAQGASAAGGAAQMMGEAIPYVNLAYSLTNVEEDPWSAVAAACAFIPVYGQLIAAFITIVQLAFPTDIDPTIGEAEAHIDPDGNVSVNTTIDEEGGGSTAAHWAEALAHMALAAGMTAPQAGAAAQHLPSVGYYFDPDGVNLSDTNGQLELRWVDENGNQRQRIYDANGMAWDGNTVEGQSDIMRDYQLLITNLEPKWPPVMFQEVAGGILQLDYGVATVLYATALGSFDGQAAHTHGGEEDSDGGIVELSADSALIYSLQTHTIANTSEQTEQTLTSQDLRSVPPSTGTGIGNSANGPQIPKGKDPIVFVPVQAMVGNRTVTDGMVNSLGASDAQLAALAIAMGAGGLPFMSHAQDQGGGNGGGQGGANGAAVDTSTGQPGGYAWGIASAELNAQSGAGLTPGGWTDASGQTIAPPVNPAQSSPLGVRAEQTPELLGDPPAFDGAVISGGESKPAGGDRGNSAELPEGYGAQEHGGSTAAVLTAGDDTVLDYPTVQGDYLEGTEDQTLRFSAQDLLANDSTPNPVPKGLSGDYFNGMRIVSVGDASHGSVGIQNGQLVFVPDANYNGPASFNYTIVDMYGLTHTGTVTVMVEAVNDTPEARGESATGNEDTDLVLSAAALLANDRDIDGARLRISQVGEASGGTVLLQPDGSVRFIPTPNYNGPAGYTYWVSDGQEQVAARVNLNILQVNDLPVVQGELVASDEDVVLNFPFGVLLANDSDIDTDPALNQAGVQVLTISAVGNALHGSVAIVDGQVRFTPEANYFGPASFDYLVDDGAGGQVSTTVVLNLAPVNDAPDVMGETATLAEDNTLIYTQAELLANDSDVDNPHGDLVISQVGGAQNGSVEILPDGRIRFTPDADYFGPAQFDYLVDDGVGGQSLATVALDITPVNDAPRLVGEQVSLDEDTVITVSTADLLDNDSDVDNEHADLHITGVGNAVNGTVTLDASGNVSFAPTLNFYGQASFTYTVSDGVGGSSTTSMVLDYASVNDLPVVNDELIFGKQNNTYILTAEALLRNDTDVEHPSGLQIVSVGAAENGAVTLLGDGRIQFVPNADYASWDPPQFGSFEYTVRDPDGGETVGKAEIDYSRVNVNPIAVDDHFQGYEDVRLEINVGELLRNDRDPDATGLTTLQVTAVAGATHGTVSLSNGVVTFNPTRDYSGAAQFQYQIDDGEGGTTWATAYIDLERENRPPVIDSLVFLGGTLSTPGNTSLTYADPGFWDDPVFYIGNTITVRDDHLVNGRIYAHDPDGDTLTFSISPLDAPGHGQAFIGEHIITDAPRGLTLAQLQGRVPIGGFESWYTQTFTPSSLGTGPMPGLDPTMPYGGNRDYFVDDERTTGAAYSAWQYVYTDARARGASDQFVITVTDSRGASVTQVVTLNWTGAGYAPIVVDMGNNGLDLLPANYSMRYMDINGDGVEERLGWVAPSDALLAFDKDNNGRITDSDEISFVGYTPGARTDLEGLAAFDTNGDGRLTAEDDQWAQFGLLQDFNGNGVQDEGEWITLTDAGLTGMDLQREGTPELNNGNVVFGTTTLTYADGSTLTAGDVMFAGEGVALPDWAMEGLNAAPSDSTADLADLDAGAPEEAFAPAPVADPLLGADALDALPAGQGGSDESMGEQLNANADTQVSLTVPVATLADDAAIDRQAQLFVQTVTTQDQASEPLGFVNVSDMSLSTEPDVFVLADQPIALPAVAVSTPSMVPA